MERSVRSIGRAAEQGIVSASDVLRGTGGRDVAVLTRLDSFAMASGTRSGHPIIPGSSVHMVEIIGHITAANSPSSKRTPISPGTASQSAFVTPCGASAGARRCAKSRRKSS